MHKKRQEAKFSERRGATIGCAEGPFCSVRGREQKQIHHPDFIFEQTRVPEPLAASGRRIWLRSCHGT